MTYPSTNPTTPSDGANVEITPEMIEAGTDVLLGYLGGDDPRVGTGELATMVFQAMSRVRALERRQPANKNPAAGSRDLGTT